MSCTPEDLQKRCQELAAKWQTCTRQTGLDSFVEFAVSVSSFTEFLEGHGLSGLHQSAHSLEQKVLSLMDQLMDPSGGGALSADASTLLNAQVQEFAGRVQAFVQGHSSHLTERRHARDATPDAEPVSTLELPKNIAFVTDTPTAWKDLVAQVGFFHVQVEMVGTAQTLAAAPEPAMVLVDAANRPLTAFVAQVQTLRGQFSASNIVGVNVGVDFESQQQALSAGCDACFATGTQHAAIMARIVKLCSNEEEPAYRVLVVEDSKTAGAMIRRTLSEAGIESLAITRPQDVLTALVSFQPDLVLMDMYMPGCTGVEVTRVIRQHAEFLSTPVVYLSGDSNVALQVDALRLGGDHFLTKPFNPVILNAVVKSKIDRYRTLRRTMLHDSLTGLLNHTTSKQQLQSAINAARLDGSTLCVAMVDIDHFKSVNDTYGHPMGDHVIRSLSWLLKQRVRKTDAVGRYGGEEFVVILPGALSEQAYTLLDRIRVDFSRIRHPVDDGWFSSNFSGGIAQWNADLDSEALLKRADEALYQAKRAGRNRLQVLQSGSQAK
ncbi:GGDEF domain-containing response regulator [Rhodoferax saidenbachensis]|uniref:diguanylate cyclase n=1 Tax=Rhodoferax saidenbachensis TaxID=1484693 RepID=A0A1P8K810_9BURK|nr:diguanylate cyclase [Rhodoferax saidenbachensis]APW42132.1 diguanylate cyclase response regulator [Rhodoferax saidenbachensis]